MCWDDSSLTSIVRIPSPRRATRNSTPPLAATDRPARRQHTAGGLHQLHHALRRHGESGEFLEESRRDVVRFRGLRVGLHHTLLRPATFVLTAWGPVVVALISIREVIIRSLHFMLAGEFHLAAAFELTVTYL